MQIGTIFEYDGETWVVVNNDGFILDAENLNPDSMRRDMMWIGGVDKMMSEIKIVKCSQ